MRGGHITTETVYEFQPKQHNLQNTRSITNLRTIFPPRATQVLAPSRISSVIRPVTSSVEVRKTATPIRISQAPSIPPISSYQIQPISTSIVDHNTMRNVAIPKIE